MSTACRDLACRWFEELWNQRRPEVVHELIHAESVGHTLAGDVVGPEPFLERIYRPFLASFPDLHITIEDTLENGENAAVRWRATGTHTGAPFAGLPSSGRRIDVRGITWFRAQGGLMAEGWDCWDSAALMAQLRDDATP